MHLGHDNLRGAATSLGLRLLLIGTTVAVLDHCLEIQLFSDEKTTNDSGTCAALTITALATLVAIPIADFATAFKIVERPASSVGLVVAPGASSRALSLSLAGRF